MFAFVGLTLLLAPAANVLGKDDAPEPLTVIHSISGWSPAMKAFQMDLMRTLLRLSSEEEGDYNAVFDDRNMTTSRSMLATRRGEIHTGLTTGWGALRNSKEHVTLYRYPYLKSLLGLRRFIIRAEDRERFESIRSVKGLKGFRAGQGAGWPDTRVYREAGIEVVEAENYPSLFPMLAKGRFDFLPLSVLEVEGALAAFEKDYPSLIIAENMYVFYPIPLYISVSNTKPKVSERLKAGLDVLFDPDSPFELDNLMLRHFPLEGEIEIDGRATLITMNNPYAEAEINLTMLRYFSEHYRVTLSR